MPHDPNDCQPPPRLKLSRTRFIPVPPCSCGLSAPSPPQALARCASRISLKERELPTVAHGPRRRRPRAAPCPASRSRLLAWVRALHARKDLLHGVTTYNLEGGRARMISRLSFAATPCGACGVVPWRRPLLCARATLPLTRWERRRQEPCLPRSLLCALNPCRTVLKNGKGSSHCPRVKGRIA
jgi:hypothetical protein